MVHGFEPHIRLCAADSSEPGACFGVYVSLSAPPLLTLPSLSLSLKKINIKNTIFFFKCQLSDKTHKFHLCGQMGLLAMPELSSHLKGQARGPLWRVEEGLS